MVSVFQPASGTQACGGKKLRVAFYDAGQALAALVTLPDGKHILVDAGESPTRAGCGKACKDWHERVLAGLTRDLGGAQIDLLWITHQHSDHLGGVPGVAQSFKIAAYVDNGRDLRKAIVKQARDSADDDEARVVAVGPGNETVPLTTSANVQLTAIVPDAWPTKCKTDANACSILLRIDYCASSVLFTGDAEKIEESQIDTRGKVTLLQVGHHGSATSTSARLIKQARPKYAVISSALPGEGTNKDFCHPRKTTVDALTAAMGGATGKKIRAFHPGPSNAACSDEPKRWVDTPASATLWATARDGEVVLTTTGDGKFRRE